MKLLQSLALVSMILVSGTSLANPNYYHFGYHPNPYGWVAPLVIGGVVTYAITRPQQQTVVIQQPPSVYYQQPATPYGYHYENILDANCNCYRLVLVQNQP
jgi:hypothetical protein